MILWNICLVISRSAAQAESAAQAALSNPPQPGQPDFSQQWADYYRQLATFYNNQATTVLSAGAAAVPPQQGYQQPAASAAPQQGYQQPAATNNYQQAAAAPAQGGYQPPASSYQQGAQQAYQPPAQ